MEERFFWLNTFDTSQTTESSYEKELIESSQKKDFFLEYSKPDEHSSSDTSSNLKLNDSSYSKISSLAELNDYSNSISFDDIIQNDTNINYNNKTITESKNDNIFLGKKRKIFFYVIKNGYKKPFFLTNNINNITSNNSNKDDNNILNRQDSKNYKEKQKNIASEEAHPKNKKVKLFNTYIDLDNYPKNNLNEGKWSYDEHIKFIIAYVNYRKNYKLIQKYISSRNGKQIRSHAQKFFIRLKQFKNSEYDFSSDEIKNLFDIFDIIENNNKTNMNNKEYIINTLMTLCENKCEKKEDILIKSEEEKNIDELFLDNKSDTNVKNIIYENEEINKDNISSKEIYLNNIIEREQNKEAQEQENYWDYNYLDNRSNNVFLSSNCIYSDEISSKTNNNIFYKDRNISNFNFINNYFS